MVTRAIKACAAFVLALLAVPAASMATFGQVSGTNGGGEPFVAARAIAVAPDGSVYVLDARKDGVQRVRRLTGDLQPMLTFGRPGSGPGELSGAEDLSVDTDGNVYVTDVGNDRIQKFTAEGTLIDARWSGTSATHIASGNGVVLTAGPPLRGFNTAGDVLFSREGLGGAVAAGAPGEVFQNVVAGVARLGPDGRLLGRIGEVAERGAVGAGQLRGIGAFTVTPRQEVFVADPILQTLQQFEVDGRFVAACSRRSLRRSFLISDMAGAPSGELYAAEGTRVTRFADVPAPAVACDETAPRITSARLVPADAGASLRRVYRLRYTVSEAARIDLTAVARRRGERPCARERVTPRRTAVTAPRRVSALVTVTVPRGCRLVSVTVRARDAVGNTASARVRKSS